MKNINFPIFKTKINNQEKKFNLSNPEERLEYFNLKAGKEIQKLKDYSEIKRLLKFREYFYRLSSWQEKFRQRNLRKIISGNY
jgi:hypothetical protein